MSLCFKNQLIVADLFAAIMTFVIPGLTVNDGFNCIYLMTSDTSKILVMLHVVGDHVELNVPGDHSSLRCFAVELTLDQLLILVHLAMGIVRRRDS